MADTSTSEFLTGVQQYALLHPGVRPRIHLIDYGRSADLEGIARFLDRLRFDGVLAPDVPETRGALHRQRMPVVNVQDVAKSPLPTVMYDQVATGRCAAEYLIGQGIPQLAYLASEGYYAQLRRTGYRDAAAAASIPCLLFDDATPDPAEQGIPEKVLQRWLADLPKPVGIHTANVGLALRIVWACAEIGLRVPQDVVVLAGQDRPQLTATWEPTLSAFDMARERLGIACMELLDRLIAGQPAPPAPVLLGPGPLIERQSTDVQGTRDPDVAAALRVIRDNAHRPIAVKEVLEHVPVSRSTLDQRFVQIMGHSIHDEIVRVHMGRAKKLLTHVTLSVEQVAIESGFSGAAVFCTAFRKQTGLTPTQYRAKNARA